MLPPMFSHRVAVAAEAPDAASPPRCRPRCRLAPDAAPDAADAGVVDTAAAHLFCTADVLLKAAQERRRQQQEAGLILNRVVYVAVHFVPASMERMPGHALLFESRFESGNLRPGQLTCAATSTTC